MGKWRNQATAIARRHGWRTWVGDSVRQEGGSPNHAISRSLDHPIRGFTIIELLVVMAIIVILASVTMVQYRNSVTRSKESVLKEDLFRLRDAIDQYYADKNEYPTALSELASSGYIREVPVDPFTNSASTWQEIPAEPDPNNPLATLGIYDVKSGSEQTALDGSQYSQW